MATTDLLRITRIVVHGLFDTYDHDVRLHLEDRVTIIHGPNGVGKTMLLRLTSSLLSGRVADVVKVPFSVFEVSLSDGSTIGVERSASEEKGGVLLRFYLHGADKVVQQVEMKSDQNDMERLANVIERETPWLAKAGPDQFLDQRSNEVLTAYEVVNRFPEFLPERYRKKGVFAEPPWSKEIRKRVGVHLIEAQRLIRFASPREWSSRYYLHGPAPQSQYIETVKNYSKELQKRISEVLTAYAKESQSLDQSFPERLLKNPTWDGLPVEALKSRMQGLERKRQQLKRIGLIEEDAAYPFDVSALEKVDATQRSVMTLYVDDTAKKLGVLDDLANRIEILLEKINRKFQGKTIVINKEKGFVAVTAAGQSLDLEALSSGEQHELVLLYDLLFRVKPNTLVLIDEPELSLHVTWQKTFLPDLLEIVAATGFDVILATHSPFIVGDRNDLMVSLSANGGTLAA